MNKTINLLRICEDCGYLINTSYEYPEPACSAGVSENDPLMFEDKNGNYGCIYTDRQLMLMRNYQDEMWEKSHDYSNYWEWVKAQEKDGKWQGENESPFA